MGDLWRQQRQSRFQHGALQAVAPPVRVHYCAVCVGPVLPLTLRHAQKGGIVFIALPAQAQDEVRAQPPLLPRTDTYPGAQIVGNVFQRIRHELLRVRHGGAHFVLQREHCRSFDRGAAPQGDSLPGGLAAYFLQKIVHLYYALQNKIVLFSRFQYK